MHELLFLAMINQFNCEHNYLIAKQSMMKIKYVFLKLHSL